VYLAQFPYADLEASKRRPVCVVSGAAFNQGPDVIVAMVTSRRARLRAPCVGDVVLQDWESAGLLVPSTLRAGRVNAMEARLLDGRLGSLSRRDLAATAAALRTVLELT
jgi:mRNA-degrading endonuclease toxin of MazEF toxin-antitoxin module